ncbi:HpcH/HpaI aldolase/citrate lyase family protein [Aliiroseovarius sp. F20344]|uniref:HpcH/HpaI aldolase family protein n=1 Tax=Aliiroseovarius sp. F20344 TaxID=2926414 RepID=UPI001FF51A8C|nr:HpcH/HpaI aldolase/citrate lyase family protein [Aliiroseovarius sp. F20344]MCK0143525.1 HpcH/HpaI aldolase/citrate lyase family protein [Aliiroseovarius sp. F20344]
MPASPNKLKRHLAGKNLQIGLWLNLGDVSATEIAASAGFDWCLIDGEHAPYDPVTIQNQLRAMAAFDSVPVVRVPIGEDWIIKQVLDIGAQSLLVPMVDTPEHAKQMVAATRYAPEGRRGMGAAVARASGWGRVADYGTNINDEICLIVQAETRLAMQNIDQIAAVEGVDCVFIGPADLSADMGHRGNPGHPEVKEAIADGIARILAAGKAAGILHYDSANFAYYRDLGVTFLGVGSEASLLRAAVQETLKDARRAVSD